jgi:carbamoyltransferase
VTTIVGINAYHGDASACLVRDGTLVAAAEEERFRRIKHWAGFPGEAIRYCLQEGGLTSKDVDHVAVNRRPSANMLKKALFAFSQRPSLAAVTNRLRNAARVASIEDAFADACDAPRDSLRATFHAIEHHRAHMASAFFVSPFDQAAVVSVDGFGDFVSTMWGVGAGSRLTVHDEVNFPHSLGLFYLAMTQYLGFPHYGDEYKVMGLAPYGSPQHLDKMRTIVRLLPRGRFEIALDYFRHHSEGVSMVWEAGEPTIGTVFDKALEDLLGPARGKDEPISQYHKDLAASMQAMYEEAFFHLLNHVHQAAASDRLCLAGGCAMNSVANGKVFEQTPFRDIYIQSAAGDAGGAIGAAYAVWHEELGNPRCFVMTDAYLGPQFADDQIGALLRSRGDELAKAGCHAERISSEDELCLRAATALVNGSVVGWFQGRMEWGPRALGNRSILGDPRRSDMKDILNLKIKRRESFRPFAPSILRESVHDWFETDYDVPFMLQVYQVRPEQRRRIPAVTHVNGSGRLQTVTKQQNRRYYALIKAFEMQTGVPMVLNTSFNENEPVVCRPEEALDCFLRTRMDVLVLGEWVLSRGASA